MYASVPVWDERRARVVLRLHLNASASEDASIAPRLLCCGSCDCWVENVAMAPQSLSCRENAWPLVGGAVIDQLFHL